MMVRADVIREVRGFEDAFRGMYDDSGLLRQGLSSSAGGHHRRVRVSLSPAPRHQQLARLA